MGTTGPYSWPMPFPEAYLLRLQQYGPNDIQSRDDRSTANSRNLVTIKYTVTCPGFRD
jgi:hypothetical protein